MRTTRMGTTVRSTPTAHQRAEAVADFRLLPWLIEIGIDGGGSISAAGFLGSLNGAQGADRRINATRVIQLNCVHQGLASAFGIRGIGGQTFLFRSYKSRNISNLLRCQAKEFGQKIDLPRNHLLWRRGIERPAEPTARLRAKNSRENHR